MATKRYSSAGSPPCIDGYAAIAAGLATAGTTVEEVFRNFAVANGAIFDSPVSVDAPYSYEEAGLYPEVTFEGTIGFEGTVVTWSSDADGNGHLAPHGVEYLVLQVPLDVTTVDVTVTGDPGLFAFLISVNELNVATVSQLVINTPFAFQTGEENRLVVGNVAYSSDDLSYQVVIEP